MADPTTTIDHAKLDELLHRFVADAGASAHGATVLLGDRLGLYRALSQEPCTAAELAKRTGTVERLVLEWLRAQVASQYVSYDAARDRYYLTPEQAFAFAAADGLHCPGAYNVVSAMFKDIEGLEAAFRDGGGFGWHQHHPDLFHGTERFFRPNYAMNLVPSWIPALEGVEPKLRAGARVADVGCGHGVSTVLMAQAFPKSAFVGFDYHEASIQRARQVAQESGVGDRLRFEVASARNFPGGPYDLVTFFDCLHDMGDPAGASRHVRESLKPDGTWMVVEPYAEDEPTANFNPLGRLFYSASTMVCTPCSLAQDVGAALGAQAGEKRISQVIRQGGFRSVRRAAETPFNLVFEARP